MASPKANLPGGFFVARDTTELTAIRPTDGLQTNNVAWLESSDNWWYCVNPTDPNDTNKSLWAQVASGGGGSGGVPEVWKYHHKVETVELSLGMFDDATSLYLQFATGVIPAGRYRLDASCHWSPLNDSTSGTIAMGMRVDVGTEVGVVESYHRSGVPDPGTAPPGYERGNNVTMEFSEVSLISELDYSLELRVVPGPTAAGAGSIEVYEARVSLMKVAEVS